MYKSNHMIKHSLLLSTCVLMVLLSLSCVLAATEKMTISFIDVGQGDSIFIQFPNNTNMLLDAGDFEHGQALVNYLRSLQTGKIDILVATHPHADHIGGMESVMAAFKVGKVWDSGYNQDSQVQRKFLQTIKNSRIVYGIPKSGFTEQIGSVRVEVLAPVRLISGSDNDANNNSIVLRIIYGKVSFLLTGDMQDLERATVSSFPHSTLLKVAHHGSNDGIDAKFLRSVSPDIAVISVAEKNDYHYPHPSVLSALQKTGVTFYTTAVYGTVVITTDGNTYNVNTVKTISPAPTAPNVTGEQQQYIGNVNSKVFHLPSCNSLPAAKNRVCFKSRDEAVSQGYRACGRCRP